MRFRLRSETLPVHSRRSWRSWTRNTRWFRCWLLTPWRLLSAMVFNTPFMNFFLILFIRLRLTPILLIITVLGLHSYLSSIVWFREISESTVFKMEICSKSGWNKLVSVFNFCSKNLVTLLWLHTDSYRIRCLKIILFSFNAIVKWFALLLKQDKFFRFFMGRCDALLFFDFLFTENR